MPLAKNNRLAQPANDKWASLDDAELPVQQMLAFMDADKAFVWLGNVATADSPRPTLNGIEPAFWSQIADQPELSN